MGPEIGTCIGIDVSVVWMSSSEGQGIFDSRKSCEAEKAENYSSNRCDPSDAATGNGVKNCLC